MTNRDCQRSALTLVELLVVFTVIAICLALLLNGVQSARATSRLAACSNNLRQLHLGQADSDRPWLSICPESSLELGYFDNEALLDDPTIHMSTHTTIEYFEHNGGELGIPNANPNNWFTASKISSGQVVTEMDRYIARNRHFGTLANYLYLDGHIGTIEGKAVGDWSRNGYNFALNGNGAPP